MDGIEPFGQQEQGEHHEELKEIAAQDHQDILADAVGDDACTYLCQQLCGEGDDAEGKGPDEPADEQEEQFLESQQAFDHHRLVFAIGELGQSDADDKGEEEQREHVAFEDGAQDVVGDDADEVGEVGEACCLALLGDGG